MRILYPMGFRIPENALQKALRNPLKAIEYAKYNWYYQTACRISLGLKTKNLRKQQDKLAALRRKSNYCLIVLDACRYDLLQDVFSEYFRGDIGPTYTIATNTFEYLQYNWPEEYHFPYVTGATPVTSEKFSFDGTDAANGLPQGPDQLYDYYRGYVPRNHFHDLEEVWRDEWDSQLRTCPPEPVTRRAISRADDTEKMVAHYFQPHAPFIGQKRPSLTRESSELSDRRIKIDADIWPAVREGRISISSLHEYYISNLHRVLAAVARLIDETDFAEYVIIGDHGEALGEYNEFAHSVEHPKVAVVPWCRVDGLAEDAPAMWNYTHDGSAQTAESSTQQRLKELGYID